ncbi:hypothetical protein P8452_51705 [Trifolium repens]|nr:hypothetical protein P8452_51705 [Trifolium repens]
MQAQKKTRKTKNKFASLLPQVGSSPLLSLHRRGAAQLPTPTSHIPHPLPPTTPPATSERNSRLIMTRGALLTRPGLKAEIQSV